MGKARQNWNWMVNSAEVRTAFAEKTMSQAEAPLPQLGPGKAGSARDRALRGQEGRGRGRFPPVPAALRHLGKKARSCSTSGLFIFKGWDWTQWLRLVSTKPAFGGPPIICL